MPISPDNPAGTEWLNDCLGSSDAQDPDGRVYNRFKWCQEYEFKNRYYKKVDGKPVLKGTNTIKFQAAAIGYNDTRATRVFFRAKTGQVNYDGWNPLEKRTVAPNLKLEITPECVPGANQPTTATCGVGRSPAKMEWAQWSNFPDWVYWDVSSIGGEGQDQVAFHQWRLYMNGASPGYEQSTERGEGPRSVSAATRPTTSPTASSATRTPASTPGRCPSSPTTATTPTFASTSATRRTPRPPTASPTPRRTTPRRSPASGRRPPGLGARRCTAW